MKRLAAIVALAFSLLSPLTPARAMEAEPSAIVTETAASSEPGAALPSPLAASEVPGHTPTAPGPVPHAAAQHDPAGSHASVPTPPLIPSEPPALVTGALETERFRILYTRRSARAAELLAERIEPARDGLRSFLGRDWPGVTEVRLGADPAEMAALALPGGQPPSWAVAIAYPAHNIILLDASTLSGAEGVDTLWHELAHVALGRLGSGWPRWFQEGMAVHLTGSRFDPQRYTTLFNAVRSDRILDLADLTQGWPDRSSEVQLAYAQSAAFVGWLHDRHGTSGMARLVDRVQAGDNFELAFAKAFSLTLDSEERSWREGLAQQYGWLPVTSVTTLVLGFAALLTVWGWTRRRKQYAMRLAQMEAQEAAEEAARRLLEAELRAQEEALERLRQATFSEGFPMGRNPDAADDPEELSAHSGHAEDEDPDDDEPSWGPRPVPPKPTLH